MEQKEQHTLKTCKACQKRHQELQLNFPMGPYYFNPPCILAVNKEALDNISKKEATCHALAGMNISYLVFTTRDRELEKMELTIVGCKFPLRDSKGSINKHEKYMQLTTDEEIEVSPSDLRSIVAQYDHNITSDTLQVSELQNKQFRCTRSLIMWHDHGTILGLGCIFLTAHVVYDCSVLYTDRSMVNAHPSNQQ